MYIYSMVQNPSWEANWFAASQEIPRISRNPKVHYRTHKPPPPVLSWASPIQSIYPHPTSWRSILILSTHLRLGLPSGLFTSGFPSKTLYTPSPHPYAPHAQPISFFSILSPAQYWVRSTNHLAPPYAVSSIPPLPSGEVVYLRIILSPEQASRMWVFLSKCFYREGLLAPRPTPKLEDHPSSAVRDCLFNLFAATLLIGGRSSIRNLRTRHAVVTGTHYMENS